jgi:hypothetical protein
LAKRGTVLFAKNHTTAAGDDLPIARRDFHND